MRYYWKLIRHFICSNSRHGTHSPFVYKLAEQVIYAKKEVKRNKFASKTNMLMSEIASFYMLPIVSTEEEGRGGIFQDSISNQDIASVLQLQHKYFMLFLTDIHADNFCEKKWQQIIADKATIVTIDLFHVGIVCFRKEQPKEHFTLRFPYWKY